MPRRVGGQKKEVERGGRICCWRWDNVLHTGGRARRDTRIIGDKRTRAGSDLLEMANGRPDRNIFPGPWAEFIFTERNNGRLCSFSFFRKNPKISKTLFSVFDKIITHKCREQRKVYTLIGYAFKGSLGGLGGNILRAIFCDDLQ